MELRCAYILFFVSLVSATPYGYGTKGGALAKAEASATAGASGGLSASPFSAPPGGGFSGSYSKTSSSSFASSSASSSSSSSSFSFSGTSAGGHQGFGANGGAGCRSGGCQISGANGIANTHVSGTTGTNQVHDGANAGATAAAGSFAGSHGSPNKSGAACTGGFDCSEVGTSNKCTSGKCGLSGTTSSEGSSNSKCTSGHCGVLEDGATPQLGLSLTDQSSKCVSGHCGPNSQTASPSSDGYDSYDIPAKVFGSTSTYGSKDQDSNYAKSSTASGSISGPGCSYGNCGLLKKNQAHDSPVTYQSSTSPNEIHRPKCDSPDCSLYDYNAHSAATGSGLTVGKPVTYLTTPKEGSECTSPNCHSESNTDTGRPSSYNVPIHSSYENSQTKNPLCNGDDCRNYQSQGPFSPSGSKSFPFNEPLEPSASKNCASGKCDGHSSSQSNIDYNGPKIPTHSQGSSSDNSVTGSLYNAPASSASPCKTPNCATVTNVGSGTEAHIGVHSGGSLPSGHTSINPSHTTISPGFENPSYTGPSTGSALSNCKTPNCAEYPSGNKDGEVGASVKPGFSSVHPGSGPSFASLPKNPSYSSSALPSYNTPTIGGTTPGCSSPNCAGHHSGNIGSEVGTHFHLGFSSTKLPSETFSSPSKYPSSSGLPTYNLPSAGIPSPSCNTPNCGGYPSINTGAVSPTEQKLPVYTGGFGGPGGILRPNEFSSPSSNANTALHRGTVGIAKPNFDVSPSNQKLPAYTGGFSGPSGILKPNEFSSGNPSAHADAAAGSIGAEKPNAGANLPDQKHPYYTSGFGATSGLLGPNEFSSGNPSAHADAAAGSIGVAKPNTDVNLPDQKHPSYTSGFGAPSGLLKPNEFSSSNPSARADATEGSIDVAKSNADVNLPDQKHPSYTSGFGAPSGLLKPNEFSSGNPSAHADAAAGSIGVAKPNADVNLPDQKHPSYTSGFGAPSGLLKPNEFSSGNPSAHADAAAGSIGVAKPNADDSSPDQKHPSYTSGFGAPSGLLKPNEFSTGHSSANAGITSGSHAGSAIIAQPSTGINSPDQKHPVYSGGFGGPSGLLKPNEFSTSHPSLNTGFTAGSHAGSTSIAKPSTDASTSDQKHPIEFNSGNPFARPVTALDLGSDSVGNVKPSSTAASSADQSRPAYTSDFSSSSGLLKPNEVNSGNPFARPGAALESRPESFGTVKPGTDTSSGNQNHPTYTNNVSSPSGLSKPNEVNSGNPFARPSTALESGVDSVGTVKPGTSANTGIASIGVIGASDVTNPSATDGWSKEKLPPYTGGFGGALGLLKPNEFNIPASNSNYKLTSGSSTFNPTSSCSSGNCGIQPVHTIPSHVHGSGSSGAHASAVAVSKAEAVAYSAGFGGPPGFLKPYDDGKIETSGRAFGGQHLGVHHGIAGTGVEASGTGVGATSSGFGTSGVGIAGTSAAAAHTGAGIHSPYNSNNINGHISGDQAGATGQASSLAQSSSISTAFGGSSGGCGGGCGSSGSVHGGWPKTGYSDGLNSGSLAAGASAKSTAGAVSGAHAFGVSGSFASSSASAHASSGFPTKGGYGR